MRDDLPSRTAAYVAMGRALAHARREVPGFDDPFALELLPDDCRALVERRIRGERPRGRREAFLAVIAGATAVMMPARTMEIDAALRELPSGHQIVLLGAGLDARAYRMPELGESVVYEVDHPATQAFKRRRAAGLRTRARELRYAPVDFTRERLADGLARAGHSTAAPTAWVFEGVISYLAASEVEKAIASIAALSAPGSRLAATYNESSRLRRIVAAVTARAGEPMRSTFSPAEMWALLERNGFRVHSDRDGVERARRVGQSLSRGARVSVRPHHVVVADFGVTTRPERAARG